MTAKPAEPTLPRGAVSGGDVAAGMRDVLNRIATGPELSKDLGVEQAREAMRWILQGKVDPVQAAVFLIALRMKRETPEENLGVLLALRDECVEVRAPVAEVVSLADPHNGYTRCLPMSPFLPPVLAACGVPCIRPGLRSVGPKFGITDHEVLRAAGVPVDLDMQAAAARLGDPRIGWSYVDQSRYAAGLHALVALRNLIVKRSVLHTAEIMLAPIRGENATHVVAGYVHPNYPPMYLAMARGAGFDSALMVRGVEGGVIPSLQQPSRSFGFRGSGAVEEARIEPDAAGINCEVRAVPVPPAESIDDGAPPLDVPAAARACAAAGLAALEGLPGPGRSSLLLGCALVLRHLRRCESLADGVARAREAIDSGEASDRFR